MRFKRRHALLVGLAAGALAALPLPAAAQDVVKIGFSGPLSGGAALYGKNVVEGMQMAIDEINETGLEVNGKKIKLQLATLDDKYNPSEAAINVQRLVQQDKVAMVMVPHSGGIFAVQARNEAQKVLLLAYSSVPEIAEAGNKLTLMVPPSYTVYLEPFVNYGMKKFGKKIALIAGDHDFGKAWATAFKPAWEKAGGTVVADNPMSYNRSADFYSGVSKVLAEKPDVLFIGGASEPTGLVVRQARELGFKGGFLLIDQAKLNEVAEVTDGFGPLEGAIGVLPVANDPSPLTQAYIKRYQARYGANKIPGSETSLPYITVHAAADAMKLAGTTSDAEAIFAKFGEAYAGLPEEVNFGGFTGVDEKGHAVYDGRLAVIENGEVKEVMIADLTK